MKDLILNKLGLDELTPEMINEAMNRVINSNECSEDARVLAAAVALITAEIKQTGGRMTKVREMLGLSKAKRPTTIVGDGGDFERLVSLFIANKNIKTRGEREEFVSSSFSRSYGDRFYRDHHDDAREMAASILKLMSEE